MGQSVKLSFYGRSWRFVRTFSDTHAINPQRSNLLNVVGHFHVICSVWEATGILMQ